MHVEDGRLRRRLTNVERRVEGEQRSMREKNVIIKGLRLNSETGEENVKNLMRDIEAQMRMEGVKRVGGRKGGKACCW